MTTHPAVPTRNDMDQAMIHQVVAIAPQPGLATLSDASGVSTTYSHKDDELVDPEIVSRNVSGWLAGG